LSTSSKSEPGNSIGDPRPLLRAIVRESGPKTSNSKQWTHLAHELWNDTVELGSLESKSMLPSAQGTEVLRSLRDNVAAEFEHNTTGWYVVNGDIKVAFWKRPETISNLNAGREIRYQNATLYKFP
jgi:hypothetical protein